MIYHFYIELQQTNPLVWRRLLIAPGYTLYQLHLAIQGAFGWGNSHLFKFCEDGLEDPGGYGHVFTDSDIDDLTKDAKKASIDVGGVSGYEHMLEVMADTKDPERKEFITWLGLGPREKWKPDFFSVRDANIRLALLEW